MKCQGLQVIIYPLEQEASQRWRNAGVLCSRWIARKFPILKKKKKESAGFCPLRFIQHPVLTAPDCYEPNVNRKTRGDVLWAFSPPWTRAESLKGSGAPGSIVTAVHGVGTESDYLPPQTHLPSCVVYVRKWVPSREDPPSLPFPLLAPLRASKGIWWQHPSLTYTSEQATPTLPPTLLNSNIVLRCL